MTRELIESGVRVGFKESRRELIRLNGMIVDMQRHLFETRYQVRSINRLASLLAYGPPATGLDRQLPDRSSCYCRCKRLQRFQLPQAASVRGASWGV